MPSCVRQSPIVSSYMSSSTAYITAISPITGQTKTSSLAIASSDSSESAAVSFFWVSSFGAADGLALGDADGVADGFRLSSGISALASASSEASASAMPLSGDAMASSPACDTPAIFSASDVSFKLPAESKIHAEIPMTAVQTRRTT